MSAAFLFDLNSCTGCAACRLACTVANRLEWGTSWREVTSFNEPRFPALPQFHISHACNHCADAPCVPGCPATAIRRDETTGAVLIDPDLCIGCRYCGWVCPFGAPVFDEEAGVMMKCTFCRDRHDEGLPPACVETCPTGALRAGSVDELVGVERVEGYPAREVGAGVRFVPLRISRRGPRSSLDPPVAAAGPPPGQDPAHQSGADLPGELPLILFTATAAALVSWWIASLLGFVEMHRAMFLAIAIGSMVVSALHLGRPSRAWMATRGPRHSWLSREILLYFLFVVLSALQQFGLAPSPHSGWLATAAGLATLFAIDRVYDPLVSRRPVPLHPADTLLTALFLIAVLAGNPHLALFLGTVKLALYLRRPRFRAPVGVVRIGCGFLLPSIVWLSGMGHGEVAVIALVGVGELIDRCEFYLDLEISTPAGQMRRALERRLTDPATGP
jgi:DMSO reductase iron-sulfur subunit